MSIGNWLAGKLAKRWLPTIEQAYIVLNTIEITLRDTLKKLPEAGIPHGTTVYENMKALCGAVFCVKAALIKIIVFTGGTISNTSQGYITLNDSVETLKDMI